MRHTKKSRKPLVIITIILIASLLGGLTGYALWQRTIAEDNQSLLGEAKREITKLQSEVVFLREQNTKLAAGIKSSLDQPTTRKLIADLTGAEVDQIAAAVVANRGSCSVRLSTADFVLADAGQTFAPSAGDQLTSYQKSPRIDSTLSYVYIPFSCNLQAYKAVLKKVGDTWQKIAENADYYMLCKDVDGKAVPAALLPKCYSADGKTLQLVKQ